MNIISPKQNILYIFLLSLIIIFTQCSGSTDTQLKKIAEEANKECPKMLDQWTRLDSCVTYPGKTYKYFHTMVNNASVSDVEQFKSTFKPVIVNTIKTHPAMKFFRENEVILQYQYSDESGETHVTIEVTPEDYKE
ncbi:MAG: hypothetical protein ACK5KT_05690 [Dysgonomonas sp.]